MKKIILILLITIISTFNSAYSENTLESELKVGDYTFTLKTNHLSSGYCRGGELIMTKIGEKKEIYSSKDQCIISIEEIDNNTIGADICYTDLGGSGECGYIEAYYNIKKDLWSFYYMLGSKKPEGKGNLNILVFDYFDFSLFKFLKDFKHNSETTSITNVIDIYNDYTEVLSKNNKQHIDNLIKKHTNTIKSSHWKIIENINSKIFNLKDKNIQNREFKLGVYQYVYEKIYELRK